MNSRPEFDYVIAELNYTGRASMEVSIPMSLLFFLDLYTKHWLYCVVNVADTWKKYQFKSVYINYSKTQYKYKYKYVNKYMYKGPGLLCQRNWLLSSISMILNHFSFSSNVQNKMEKNIVIRCDVFNFLLSIENRNLQRQVKSIQSCTPSSSTHRALVAKPIMALVPPQIESM